jgi:hypothetical protein
VATALQTPEGFEAGKDALAPSANAPIVNAPSAGGLGTAPGRVCVASGEAAPGARLPWGYSGTPCFAEGKNGTATFASFAMLCLGLGALVGVGVGLYARYHCQHLNKRPPPQAELDQERGLVKTVQLR